ncbi:hypothetical protein LRAMOSA01781 [Lichtheimia ramosa]|uniref:Phospholipase A-2-activating protein n=1 Tax=Lichtheimia ramosa TaxID=688394 RepID=A0A077WMC6_9FUNG|nr:hypothetical protein LRAMOSA01781 [Lichtheimia ramosa]
MSKIALGALSNDLILSAARDKTVRSWRRTSSNTFEPENTFRGHEHFVNSLAILPPTSTFPNGLVASGGSDRMVYVYDPSDTKESLYTLVGHSENVCCLTTSPGGDIISGSWDKTAIVWKGFQESYTLKGHTAAVWAVLALEDDLILTGAADKTIRLWKKGKEIKVFHGHTDAVRGLALVPGIGFVSCSNDGTLRVWTLDGECIQELSGHTSFVYSVTVLSTGEFVSSSEDRSVRIWKDGGCVQTLQQPCVSVWTVSKLPNDDILVGGSDSVVRVFTRADERMADADTQKQFDELIASQSIPSNQIGDVNKEKLAGPEALNQPGKSEGQVIMVNNNGTVEAHQWSSQTQTWQKIGDVVGGVGSGSKQLYEGKEYDYVFDIDIGAGPNAMLKLPYNVAENPYTAAQNFIWRHELPQGFLDQIADFIVKNAQGVELGQGGGQYQDPFTGGNSYRPSQPSSGASTSNQFLDPFTGGSSYRGAGAQMVSETTSPASKSKILPLTTYLSLKQANLDAIVSKLQSIDSEAGPMKLSDADMNALLATVAYLRNPASGGDINEQGVTVLAKITTTWEPAKRFPALDLLRLVSLYNPEIISAAVPDGDPVSFFAKVGGLSNPMNDKVAMTNAMLAYRGIANVFVSPRGRMIVWEKRASVVDALQIEKVSVYNGKPVRLAISTLALNLAVLLTMHDQKDEDCQMSLIGSLVELVKSEHDEENLYRILVAIGTLTKRSDVARETARVLDAAVEIQRVKSENAGKARVQQVIDELLPLLKA